ncbi:SPOR domain-containing protein, partial [Oleiphilus sp. HI0125]
LANEKNNDAADTDSGVTALESSVKPESEVVRTSTENLGTDMPEDKVIKVSVKKSQEDSSVFGGANYTLQVLGSYNESTAQRFVESNQLPDLYYVRSTYKGKAWFVVLYGRFESAFDARSADLPDVVASQKPWVRSVDGLR